MIHNTNHHDENSTNSFKIVDGGLGLLLSIIYTELVIFLLPTKLTILSISKLYRAQASSSSSIIVNRCVHYNFLSKYVLAWKIEVVLVQGENGLKLSSIMNKLKRFV